MFSEFITAGVANGWSDATARQYAKHLRYWHDWMAGQPMTPAVLRLWAATIRRQWAPATVRSAIIAVRGWLRFAGHDDLAALLRTPDPPPRIQRTITAAEVARLLEVAETPPTSGLSAEAAEAVAIRNGAIIALLYDAWLRASELCALTIDAVSIDARRCIVMGKGGREELVAFGGDTAARLRSWLMVRQSSSRALFVAIGGISPGAPLTTTGLRLMLRTVAKRAGIRHVSPHAFRRGGATQAIRNGAPTRWVQAHGRWAKLEMVERYTRALDPADMLEQYSPMRSACNLSPVTPQA